MAQYEKNSNKSGPRSCLSPTFLATISVLRFSLLLGPWFRHGGVFVGLFTSCPAGNSGRCKCLPGGRELQNLGRTNRVILTHPSIMCRMKCCQSSCFILLNKVHRTGLFLGTVLQHVVVPWSFAGRCRHEFVPGTLGAMQVDF